MYSKKGEDLIITAMADNNEYKDIVVPQEVARHLFFNMEYNITSYRNYLDNLSRSKFGVTKNQDKLDEAINKELSSREANFEAIVLRRKDFLDVIKDLFPERHKDWFDNYNNYFETVVNIRQTKMKEDHKKKIHDGANFLSGLDQLAKEGQNIGLE